MAGDEKSWFESAWDSVSSLWGGNKKVVAKTTVYRANGDISTLDEVRQECPSDWSQAAEIDGKVIKDVRANIHKERTENGEINAGMEVYVVP